MTHEQDTTGIRFTQDALALLIEPNRVRLSARGQITDFTSLDDLRDFVNRLNILLVEVESKLDQIPMATPNPGPEKTPEG